MQRLLALHIAKTGGTSLMHALREVCGDGFLHYGPIENAERFLRGQPLVEQIPGQVNFTVCFGHGVQRRLAAFAQKNDQVELATTWRDSYAHARSTIGHHRRGISEVASNNPLQGVKYNAQSRALVEAFGAWADPAHEKQAGDPLSLELIKDSFRLVKFIARTETLANSYTSVADYLGVTLKIGHHRADPNPTPLADELRPLVDEHTRFDRMVNEWLVAIDSGKATRADFGIEYDADYLADMIHQQRAIPQEQLIASAYRDVANYLRESSQLAAAKYVIDTDGLAGDYLKPITQASPMPWQLKAKRAQAMTHAHLARVALDRGDTATTDRALSCAFDLMPELTLAKAVAVRRSKSL